jgi:hypothetical protein
MYKTGMGWVSMKFVWQDISISADIFENMFDTAQKQVILNCTQNYTNNKGHTTNNE